MKTITKSDEYLRVNEIDAELKIKSGWKFTPKSQWKQKVRDINKKQKTNTEKEK